MGIFKKRDSEIPIYQLNDDEDGFDGTNFDWDRFYSKQAAKGKQESAESYSSLNYNYEEAPSGKFNLFKLGKKNANNSGSYSYDDVMMEEYYNNGGASEEMAMEMRRRNKTHTIIIVCAVFYLIFVSVGYMVTTYSNKNAQVINISLREQRDTFYIAKSHYDELLKVLIAVNDYDKVVANAQYKDGFSFAVKYQSLLKVVDANMKEVKGSEYNSNYTQLQTQNIQVYNDLAIYLQKISEALSNKDQDVFNVALTWRDSYSQQFLKYKENIEYFQQYVDLSK